MFVITGQADFDLNGGGHEKLPDSFLLGLPNP
jgi:hypothetical protein